MCYDYPEVVCMNENKQEPEVLMQDVQPEDLPTEAEKQQEKFYPSPKWKRVLAWTLFGVMVVAIICWLVNIAEPEWADKLLGYFRH